MNNLENIVNHILKEVKYIEENINHKETNLYNVEDNYKKIKNFEKDIKSITNKIKSIDSIINNIKIIYNYKLLNIKKHLYEPKQIKNDENYSVEYKNITNKEDLNSKIYMKCPVITLSKNNLDLIVNTPIYYIKETQQYCIKINNKLIKGNIGNIISENDINKNHGIKYKKCKKINCDNKHYNKECIFYHKNDIRNFPNYSWKYINKNKIGKVKNVNNNIQYNSYDLENSRFIGSLDTLVTDLQLTNKYEKKLRNNQLMHDILLYQILDQYLEY